MFTIATTGAATKTPCTPKAATHKSIEKITATGCHFMPARHDQGHNHIAFQSLDHQIGEHDPKRSHAAFLKSEQEGRHGAQQRPDKGNCFQDTRDQPQDQRVHEAEDWPHE